MILEVPPIKKSINLRDKKYHQEKEVILNKDISKVIQSKNSKTNNIEITYCNKLSYAACCGESKTHTNFLYKLISSVDTELDKKCDFVEITKSLDQLRLLKKVILNKGQCLILNNRDLKIVTEKAEEQNVVNKEKNTEILNYIKERKENKMINQIDMVLFNYLPKEIKEGIGIIPEMPKIYKS